MYCNSFTLSLRCWHQGRAVLNMWTFACLLKKADDFARTIKSWWRMSYPSNLLMHLRIQWSGKTEIRNRNNYLRNGSLERIKLFEKFVTHWHFHGKFDVFNEISLIHQKAGFRIVYCKFLIKLFVTHIFPLIYFIFSPRFLFASLYFKIWKDNLWHKFKNL